MFLVTCFNILITCASIKVISSLTSHSICCMKSSYVPRVTSLHLSVSITLNVPRYVQLQVACGPTLSPSLRYGSNLTLCLPKPRKSDAFTIDQDQSGVKQINLPVGLPYTTCTQPCFISVRFICWCSCR